MAYIDRTDTDTGKHTVSGGCYAKDVHDEMRKDEVEIGGEEKPTEEWMKPQSGEEVEG